MSEDRRPEKPKTFFESLNCAFEGIIFSAKTQPHMRLHYIIAATALVISIFLKLPLLEFVLFAMSIIMLLSAELMNTAIEQTVDLVEEKYHEKAKNAKDAAAGGVYMAGMAVALMCYVIFTRYVIAPYEAKLRGASEFPPHMAVMSLLAVLILVVVLKAWLGRGRPLHGGMPSGHAALAFSVLISVTLIVKSAIVSALIFVLALLVAQSRVMSGVHTFKEVVLGAILGAGVTFGIYLLFTMVIA